MKPSLDRSKINNIWRFIKFCLVGGSGVVVDMAVFYLFADHRHLEIPYPIAKVFAAEVALLNNFFWNEVWTFNNATVSRPAWGCIARRLLKFQAICGIGILWAVLLLYIFHHLLKLNLYVSNLLAIGLVTFWNYWLNSRFNWQIHGKSRTNIQTRNDYN